MISLIFYFLSSVNKSHPAFLVVILALVFSWVGDVALMFQNDNQLFFIIGLAGFLISHALYIISYRKSRTNETNVEISKPRLARYNFFFLLICLTLLMVLRPNLGELLFPVICYAFVLTFMAITAMHRYGRTNQKSFWLVMVGAMLFMASDSTLALNKFMEPIPHAGFIIMLTYISAQYFIVEGLIKHDNR